MSAETAERQASISNADLTRLRALIYEQSGINLGADKKTMLELRLKPRLRALQISSVAEYCEYLFGDRGHAEEMVPFLDSITTNKTDFFREPGHFDYLIKRALPQRSASLEGGKPLLVWSAGCSTGEEAYTLAIVLQEYATAHPGFRFRVLATDLCTEVLEKANLAIFKADVVAPVPVELRRKYFLRSRDRNANLLRVVPALRNLVEFRRLNFMESDYGLEQPVDMVFCRNVIIYFDRQTQEQILQKLVRNLVPGGHAFLGHSETVHGLDVPLVPVAPALYRKGDASARL